MATDVSLLTPSQLTAASYLLQNQGLTVNVAFTTSVTTYTSTPLISALKATQSAAVGVLNATNLAAIKNLAANTCPALSDSIPPPGTSTFGVGAMSTLLITTAAKYMGGGDLSKFAQAVAVAQGYCSITNVFINSAVNSQSYLGNTFTNNNNMMSGDITAVNLCTQPWSSDLANLGLLYNLAALDEVGSPLALVKQIAAIGGITPTITIAFSNAGVGLDTVVNLSNPDLTVTDAEQKAMYAAMTQITGSNLTPTLQLLGVKTANIVTMADLLNPFKLFPNSYKTLTVTDINGVSQKIYTSNTGTVNNSLSQVLPTISRTTLT